jgi:hypothetical protein
VLEEIRRGIIAYNAAVGTPNSDTRGYHETITAFYVWAIRNTCAAQTRSFCSWT